MKLSELAYQRFKEDLFGGRVKPGQFVSQRELVRLTGVSLAPMREALLKLEAEGLVQLVPQRGIQVAEASLKMIRNAFQLRMIVEKEAVRLFVESAAEAEIVALLESHEEVLAQARLGIGQALLERAQTTDWRLHDTLVACLGNELVSDIHRVNSDRIRLIRLDHGLLTAANLASAMEEHLAILEACRRREPEAAAAAVERHLSTAMRRAMGV
ncbi:GntR family transcriptional regulator [Geminicoccaceae bacterium 1502E]|nr:GntR family transcriptional regulator [Geminicoccaceae bacterium 1502E]